jgi:hypothetical protein
LAALVIVNRIARTTPTAVAHIKGATA